jgi:hypothetical protein
MSSVVFKRYESREQALEQIMVQDRPYKIIHHSFPKGTIIKTHTHVVDEWVIFSHGRCEVTVAPDVKTLEARTRTYAIKIPHGKMHSLECLSDITYWVLRGYEQYKSTPRRA